MQKLKEIAQNINQNKAERSLKSDWENEQVNVGPKWIVIHNHR